MNCKPIQVVILSMVIFPLGVVFAASNSILVLTQPGIPQYQQVLSGVKLGLSNKKFSFTVVDIEDQYLFDKASTIDAALVLSIGTKASRLAVQVIKNRPIVFAMVLNPVEEGLVTLTPKPVKPQNQVTGVAARISPQAYIDYAKKIQPHIKKIGVLYTPQLYGDYINELSRYAKLKNIEVIHKKVASKRVFTAKFQAVIKQNVDLYMILPDFKIYDSHAVQYTLLNTFKAGIPCIGPSFNFVKSGALWGLTIAPQKMGEHTAQLIHRLLDTGRTIPWVYAHSHGLSLNVMTAQKLGIEIPKRVLQAEGLVTWGAD